MSKIKNSGLDQYGDEPFEQQQFWTAGIEGVKRLQVELWSFNLFNASFSKLLLFGGFRAILV